MVEGQSGARGPVTIRGWRIAIALVPVDLEDPRPEQRVCDFTTAEFPAEPNGAITRFATMSFTQVTDFAQKLAELSRVGH